MDAEIKIKGRIAVNPKVPPSPRDKFIPTLYDVDDTTILRVDHTTIPEFWLEIDISNLIVADKLNAEKLDMARNALTSAHMQVRDLTKEVESLKQLNDNLEMKNMVLRDNFTPICIACGRPCIMKEHMGQCRDCYDAMRSMVEDLTSDSYKTPPHSPVKARACPDAPCRIKRSRDEDDDKYLYEYMMRLESELDETTHLLKKYRTKFAKCLTDLEKANIELRDAELNGIQFDPSATEEDKQQIIDAIYHKYEPDYSSDDESETE